MLPNASCVSCGGEVRMVAAITDHNAVAPPTPTERTPAQRLLDVSGIDVLKCPCCRTGRMQKGAPLAKNPVHRIRSMDELVNTS